MSPPSIAEGDPGRPLRIALVVPGGVDESGERRVIPVLLALIERLARRHKVRVFALRQYDEPRDYRLLGAQVTNLGRPKRLAALPGHTMGWRYRALATGLREQPFDVVHAFWATGPGWLATTAAARLGIPTVVSLAGDELVGLAEIGYGAQLSWPTRQLVRGSLKRATVLTCASGPMSRLAARHGREAFLVPLGMPLPHAAATTSTVAHAAGPPRLLFVGSLNRVKDPFTLLAALRLVVDAEPEAMLDVVGEDTLRGEVQRRAAELGLGANARFHGFIPHAQLAPFYRSAHMLLVTSRHEAGPVVALEAAAFGVPVVGTRVGHLADGAGDWAETVEVGDAGGLAATVLALGHDPERRARLGAAALAWARANGADVTAQRFETLYRALTPSSR
ncbi:MAG: glycosyltransferase [Trueperaceae bacterium]